jgi:uncharacterized protein YjbJ (UPF0337 family)
MSRTTWQIMRDRGKWTARGATFVAKLKATKLVWFPPKPVEGVGKAISAAEHQTIRAAGTTTDAVTRTAGSGRTAASAAAVKTPGTARKATGTAKKRTGTKKATGTKKTTGTAKIATGTAKKATGTAKNVAGRSRRQKTARNTTEE